MSKPSFAAFYTQDQHAALLTHLDASPLSADEGFQFGTPASEAWSEVLRGHTNTALAATSEYLAAMARHGGFQPIDPALLRRRSHRIADAWNALAAGEADEFQLESLARAFNRAVMTGVNAREGANLEGRYHELVSWMDAGSMEWWEADSREPCATTGESIFLTLSNWRPLLGTVDHKIKPSQFVPLTPLPPPSVSHHVIPVPSGELLIMDWPRVGKFSEIVEDPKNDGYYDLSNARGVLRTTSWYAQKKGFMSVFVGNSLPTVLQRNGHLIIARLDDDDARTSSGPAEGTKVGRVCTDLWWATAIDRQVLVDTLARGMPHEEAAQAVAKWLEEEKGGDVMTVRVRPGQLHVYHTADAGDMQSFRSPSAPDAGVEQLFAVISERELLWAPKMLAKTSAPSPTIGPKRRP